MTRSASAPSRQRALDQKRAQRAWQDIQEVKQEVKQASKQQEQEDTFCKKYGSLARKAPMLVLTNGLGQTLAFLLSKAKRYDPSARRKPEARAHDLLYTHLSRWVLEQLRVGVGQGQGDLLEWVLSTDSAGYRRATAEALAYLNWLKRFAEAELPTEEGD